MRHNEEFDMLIRGIVATRGNDGATIDEMAHDYFEICCRKWRLHRLRTHQIVRYLCEIDGLIMVKENVYNDGWIPTCIWYIDDLGGISERLSQQEQDFNNNDIVNTSANNRSNSYSLVPAPRIESNASSSLSNTNTSVSQLASSIEILESNSQKRRTENVDEQKRPRHEVMLRQENRLPLLQENLEIHDLRSGSKSQPRKTTSTEVECASSNDFHGFSAINDNGTSDPNIIFPSVRNLGLQSTTDDILSLESSKKSDLDNCDICLLGDDFMRLLISYELFGEPLVQKKDERFSYCLPGLTINQAFTMVLDKQQVFRERYKYVLINLGAIDILLGRDITDIQAEYARLIKAIELIGLKPIITTLPPIRVSPQNPNAKQVYQMLLLFNSFLLNIYNDRYMIVDICDIFLQTKRTDPDKYYHFIPYHANVRGIKFEIWPWNQIGREKILNEIHACLKYEMNRLANQMMAIEI